CEVKIVYRRAVDQMPVGERDPEMYVRNMAREGIQYVFLSSPLRILANERNQVVGVEFQRMELGELDESGRSSVHPIPGSTFVMECDLVLEAVGESVDSSILPESIAYHGDEVIVD